MLFYSAYVLCLIFRGCFLIRSYHIVYGFGKSCSRGNE
ncbi:putative membrane protein [Anaplasma phagocytophilum str. NCH-1]|uniref:Putative membrane protein n=1 Tax=Anaplasma phagocytophilum str. NCH-1 TaxID=1359161 RepID=A0A0F3NJI7_ANAPH|nr:putative membrane protein [Anaplasma phagocytophilum str. NCH-1]